MDSDDPLHEEDEAFLASLMGPANSSPPPLSFLEPIESSWWVDLLEDFLEATRPIDENLKSIACARKQEAANMSILEHVIYSTNLALSGQWNLPRAAITFNMNQAWNLFRYGVLVGQQMAYSDSSLSGITVPKHIRLPRRHGTTLATAQRHLDAVCAETLVVHAACTNSDCQHVFYQYQTSAAFESGTTCEVCNQAPDGKRNIGLVPFPRMTLVNALARFFQNDGIEELCEKTETRRQLDQSFDQATYARLKVYRDAYSGSGWPLLGADGETVPEDGHLVLRLDIGIDWYQPSRGSHARSQSVGPIIGHITNLPLDLRAALPLTLLLGITPGEYN